MTTRSGVAYKPPQMTTVATADDEGTGKGTAATAGVCELVRLLLEDRRPREEDLERERVQREAVEAAHSKQIEEQLGIMRERLKRSTTHDKHVSARRVP